MRIDELFHQAAGLHEPPAPPDVIGSVHRLRRRRQTRALAVLAPLAVLAVVGVVLLPGGGSRTAAPTATAPAPDTFFALLNGRAVEQSRTQLQNDFGPAVAVAPDHGGAWVVRSKGTCRSVIQRFTPTPSTSFVPTGSVGDLAVSPDGRWLAYGRGGTTTQKPIGGCGDNALVIRDLHDGTERVWPGDSGGVSSLSWSSDNRHLVLQTSTCCVGSAVPRLLDTSSAPAPVSAIPLVHPGSADDQISLQYPTFAGDEVLMLADDPGTQQDPYRVVTADLKTVAVLQDQGVGLDADSSGRHLLISLYGDTAGNGSLLAITVGGRIDILGRGYQGARW